MPVIKVNDQQYPLQIGQNRLGVGSDADVRVEGDAALGVQAIIEVGADDQSVIRRTANGGVRVNGIVLGDPTPLMHGDKVEVAGHEMLYSDDKKGGATQFVSATDLAAAAKRGGPARATAATGGRLVSLVDGKEYNIPAGGVIIGRDASCGVVVAQNEVSRKHAEIAPVADGYEVRDLSANGLWVNGTRATASQVLSRADVIRVGTEEFRFYADVTAPNVRGVTPPSSPAVAPTPVAAAPVVPPKPAPPPAVPPPPPKPTADPRPVYATLEVMNGGIMKGQQHTISTPLAHVGRGAHNDIIIDDDSVSDTHAKLQRRDDGWFVVDADSTNGTYVGGQRIQGERKLEGAPDVRFGGIKMIFRAKDTAADTNKGTRAIAPVDRTKLRPTQQAVSPPTSSTPQHAAAPIAVGAASGERKGGIPAWVWIVAVVAIVAAVGFFMMKR
ncbi:MAG: FHA domain-containing protein [Gemmatimonadaceae bacterium]